MVTISKLLKLLSVGLIFLLSSFLITDLAYARGGGGGGGCFASGTSILTVRGNLPIEQLHKGDRIISYNFRSNQTEISEIGDIQVVNAEKYLLINGDLKVTESHPFYLKTSTEIKLESAQNLKVRDRLIGTDNADVVISRIDRINKNIVVYNLLSIEPNHNFYANSILVHNKGGGGGGGSGYYSRRGGGGTTSALNQKTFPEFILVAIIITGCLLPLVLFNEIVNSIRFYNKFFSDNSDLIEYTKNINSNFNNRYSLKYLKYDQPSELISIESEIDEHDYQHLCSKPELSARLRDLFVQYQIDWMNKDFDRMLNYINEPFYSEQKRRCNNYFAKSCDVVYKPELIESAPISFTEVDNKHIFLMQLNAQIINFVISTKGTVLRGYPTPYCFTEYWQIGIDTAGKWYLMNISQDLDFALILNPFSQEEILQPDC